MSWLYLLHSPQGQPSRSGLGQVSGAGAEHAWRQSGTAAAARTPRGGPGPIGGGYLQREGVPATEPGHQLCDKSFYLTQPQWALVSRAQPTYCKRTEDLSHASPERNRLSLNLSRTLCAGLRHYHPHFTGEQSKTPR